MTVPGAVSSPAPPGPLRLLAAWADTGQPADWPTHLARYGPLPARGRPAGRGLIDQVERAGLLGRGGAGFPTAVKLAEVAAGNGPALVVANGCEGDLTSNKDRAFLHIAPHLVLDGLESASAAVGAGETVLCLHRGDPLVDQIAEACAQRPAGTPLPRIVEVPARFVSSADTALVNYLNGNPAIPTARTPRPAQRGVQGRPTLVDNVETLAHLALIVRFGADWFRERGTPNAPGTTLITVTGAVRRPGVYEIELGAPLSHPLRLASGPSEPVQAVLLGGLGGRWLPLPDAAELRLSPERPSSGGTTPLGLASIIALPARACGLATTARILRYLAGESARQCGPCMFGLPAIADDFELLSRAWATEADLTRLRGRLGVIPGRGACAHPDGAAALAASALRVFASDLRAHLNGQPCPGTRHPFPLPIPENAS